MSGVARKKGFNHQSMKPSSGPLEGSRQARWQERSQASRRGTQASAPSARTQLSIAQVQLARQSRQQASETQIDAERRLMG
jgi:hypothetical protein